MQIALYRYTQESGWDDQPLPRAPGPNETDWVLFFSSLCEQDACQPIEIFLQHLPWAEVMGCSSAGNIFQNQYLDVSLVAVWVRFEHTRLKRCAKQLHGHIDSFGAGEFLARELWAEDLQAIFVLSEGLDINASRLMLGFNSVIRGRVPVMGGLAGDKNRFHSTWVWHDGRAQTDAICAIGFYGERLGVAHASCGGWKPLGLEREITRSKGNIVYEIDGQPILDLYKRYLGKLASGLPATGMYFPLLLSQGNDLDSGRVRTLLAVDETSRSMTFAGDMPQGTKVRLMRAHFDTLVEGARQAALKLDLSTYLGGGLLCIAISCVGRRLVLGPRTEEEIEAVLEVLPEETQQIGFYSYGEFSPLPSGLGALHNQTMTLSLWWER